MKYLLVISAIIIAALCSVIVVLKIENGKNDKPLTLFGNVDVRQVDISFQVPGKVETLEVEEGDIIKKDALLATLEKQTYLDKVAFSQGQIESISSSLNNAEEILKRREELVFDGAVSVEDYQTAQSTRDSLIANLNQAQAEYRIALKNLEDTNIKSPSDGVILTRIREVGSVVKETEPIYTLSLNSPIWIRAFVNERELGLIFPGMKAEVLTDIKGGKIYEGHIGFISPIAEFTPKTVQTLDLRTDLVYRLRIIVDNPDWSLKQGMPVTVKLYQNKPLYDPRENSNQKSK
jgi:HlyD family secretion protein